MTSRFNPCKAEPNLLRDIKLLPDRRTDVVLLFVKLLLIYVRVCIVIAALIMYVLVFDQGIKYILIYLLFSGAYLCQARRRVS